MPSLTIMPGPIASCDVARDFGFLKPWERAALRQRAMDLWRTEHGKYRAGLQSAPATVRAFQRGMDAVHAALHSQIQALPHAEVVDAWVRLE